MVKREINSGLARIILSEPQSGNALNVSMISQLHEFLWQSMNDKSCRTIILSAEGPNFCNGLDLQAVYFDNGPDNKNLMDLFFKCLTLISDSSVPVIASVSGNVMGGGVGLVAACDIVIAAGHVTFMLPEIIIGMIPALITPFLLRRMTPGSLRYLAISAKRINAQEAKNFGLIDEIALPEMEEALNKQIQRLFRVSPRAVAETKKYINSFSDENLERQKSEAMSALISWLSTPESINGIKAFATGCAPVWFQNHKRKK